MKQSPSLILLALGETDALAERLGAERFPGAAINRLDRHVLLRPSLATLRTFSRSSDDFLLVVPRLSEPRSRLTRLLAVLPRARRRWVADASGRMEPFAPADFLRLHLGEIVQHLLSCCLGLLAGKALFSALAAWLDHQADAERVRGTAPLRCRQPRVLYLRSEFWMVGLKGGGSVGHTAGVIDGLTELGAEVRVMAPDTPRGVSVPVSIVPPDSWFDGRLREAEQVAYNAKLLAAALGVVRSWRPNVIYQRFEAFNVVGAVLSRLLRVPLVLEFNSSDVWKGDHWGGLHERDVAALGEHINLRAADRVVVVSRILRDNLVAAGVPARKIVVNPNGVEAGQFSPCVSGAEVRRRYGLEPSEVVVGFSGTFGVWHGIPTLASAIPVILASVPDARFLLIGDGLLRPQLEQVVREHQLTERVMFTGLVAHEDMAAHLAACDILLSPHGRQADGGEFFGSPTKLYEYMAMGRAIVASRVGQIGEVLQDEQTALLVPPDEPTALAEATIHLARDPEMRRRLGQAARTVAVQRHTWAQNARNVLDSLVPPAGLESGARPDV